MGEHNDMPQEQERRATEVRLSDETIAYLEERIASAVTHGLKAAMTEETATAFWAAGLSALQQQATQSAGRFIVGGLIGLARKLSLFMMLAGIIYALGGWAAMVALAKAIFGGAVK